MQNLNTYSMDLPPAEAHAAYQWVELEALAMLGDALSFNGHMQACLLDILFYMAGPLTDPPRPVLLSAKSMKSWRD